MGELKFDLAAAVFSNAVPGHFAGALASGMLAGAMIGMERQWRQRMAGLRTNTLVAAGAALFVLLSTAFGSGDPSRVAAQVVSGIGFLGAGVIMRDGLNVSGINTAATLWCSAACGSLAGAGLFWYALAGAVMVVAVNTVLRSVSHRIDRSPGSGEEVSTPYRVEAVVSSDREAQIRALLVQSLAASEGTLRSVESEDLSEFEGERVRIRAEVTAEGTSTESVEKAVGRLSMDPSVYSAAWRHAG
ncbi:MgtC/SapB family protein [Streptomyces sp. NBC_01304]|uniref:MgtC/SapB family protein n=1 Tax=Streptomyces sp. NBC_01304 TaxID=2903818 RepID=UPI002E134805|nr:MgtC/SapB family protein [Streptomyces sp. NBC_01304]